MKRKIGKMLKNILPKTIDSIRNFTSDPINSLAYLTSVFTGIVAFISGIITYIMFIEQGGYTKQINEIKRTGALGNFENKFTTGTTNLITSGIAGKVIVFLILLEVVFLLIQYFRQNGRAKKIVLSIAGIIVIIQVYYNLIDNAAFGKRLSHYTWLYDGKSSCRIYCDSVFIFAFTKCNPFSDDDTGNYFYNCINERRC